jgi:hypothetical protein
MLFVPLAAMAQDASPLHDVGPGGMSHGPTSFAAFESRIEADAQDYLVRFPGGSADRFVKFDTTLPLEASEYEAMGKHAIVLIAAFSQKAEELPLRNVRAGDLALHCVGQIHRAVPAATVAGKFFGVNRVDAFYIVPVAVLKNGAILQADFAGGRLGFTIGDLAAREAPTFITSDQNAAPTHDPTDAALKAMIEREYPGFGIEIAS